MIKLNKTAADSLYQNSITLLTHQENLLFQRFNYFLVANSFLTIAFVTASYTSINNGNYAIQAIAYILAASGLIISWIFIVINLHNAKIITRVHLLVRNTEYKLFLLETKYLNEAYFWDKPYTFIYERISIDPELSTSRYNLILNPFEEVFNFFIKKKRLLLAPHTWLIPFLFAFIWFALIIAYILRLI